MPDRDDVRAARRVTHRFLALLAVLLVKFGGGWALGCFGLEWRLWLDRGFTLAAAALFGMLMWAVARWMVESDWAPSLVRRICVLVVSLGTLALLAGFVFFILVFGPFQERVTEREGQKVLVEYSGIFRETGYRYVNWFVHGEKLYVWQDE